MKYLSTRGAGAVDAAQAILEGLAPDGGLYVMDEIPEAPACFMDGSLDYPALSARVLSACLPEFEKDALIRETKAAYARFSVPEVTPVRQLDGETWLIELFYGPTLAFKDVALQMLPRLVTMAEAMKGEKRVIHILTATSGDTGKAALEGFRDVPGTFCTVFYPDEGVSPLQKRQMVTSKGANVQVVAVRGNFDDAQTAVKRLFADPAFRSCLDKMGRLPSSANSINIGRLLPQIVYYFYAYGQLVKKGAIRQGDRVSVCVPTGNFGDILACWYAKRMGLPVATMICASNENHVLTDFIKTGVYDVGRPFLKTISPSMDILISSNLERLLFELCGRDSARVRAMMADLKEKGRFELTGPEHRALTDEFVGVYATDDDTRDTIRRVFYACGALTDPHTAVGLFAVDRLRREGTLTGPVLSNATASPFKFVHDVSEALRLPRQDDVWKGAEALAQKAGVSVPQAISSLKDAPVLHSSVVDPDDMGAAVIDRIKGA